MAYGDKSITFKGFSSRADKKNFKLYDFECAKQDLLNRLSVRKGERVENPEFGTIIYDCIFEPLTEQLKEAIVADVTSNLNADSPPHEEHKPSFHFRFFITGKSTTGMQ